MRLVTCRFTGKLSRCWISLKCEYWLPNFSFLKKKNILNIGMSGFCSAWDLYEFVDDLFTNSFFWFSLQWFVEKQYPLCWISGAAHEWFLCRCSVLQICWFLFCSSQMEPDFMKFVQTRWIFYFWARVTVEKVLISSASHWECLKDIIVIRQRQILLSFQSTANK